jgi:hypothetical protein
MFIDSQIIGVYGVEIPGIHFQYFKIRKNNRIEIKQYSENHE